MNAATEAAADIVEVARRAVRESNALGRHTGFEEGRLAVMKILLGEIAPDRSEYVLSLITKVQALPNPNPMPLPVSIN